MDFTDMLEQVSIDEAFLDVTGSEKLFGSGREIAARIKHRIQKELQLTASVGVAQNKFIAKIASDLKKPDGLVVVDPGHEKEFLAPLPIGKLWGVGSKTEAYLKGIGLERIGQLANLQHSELASRLGKSGAHLWQLAQGIDDRPVLPEEGFKSIGHEITFEKDTSDLAAIGFHAAGVDREGCASAPGAGRSRPDDRHKVSRSGFLNVYPANDIVRSGGYDGKNISRSTEADAIADPKRCSGPAHRRLCRQP